MSVQRELLSDSYEQVLSTPSQNSAALMLKVAARSHPAMVAGAVASIMRKGSPVTMQAIGAAAVNQAVKAVAIAQTYLASDGIAIACTPSFLTLQIDDQERTAICLLIEQRGG